MSEIINKVANSKLEIFDLEDYYAAGIRKEVDIAQWLFEGFILKENDFRAYLKAHDWSQYHNCYVVIICSTDAIMPTWASVLVAVNVTPFAKKVISGSLEDLETSLYANILPNLDYSVYKDKPVILKGCSKKPVPLSAYVLAVQLLQPFAKSIMYGEACSAVLLFKRVNK